MAPSALRFEYFFDPFCGWCYASAPALDGIAEVYPSDLTMRPSGLFANTSGQPISTMAEHSWRNIQRIAKLTGQRVTNDYHDRILHNPEGIFDSIFATRAIVALGELDQALELEMLHGLQIARYADARDTAKASVVAEVAVEVSRRHNITLDENAFASRLVSDEHLSARTEKKMLETNVKLRGLSGSGIPRLLVTVGNHSEVIQNDDLYGGAEVVLKAVDAVSERAAQRNGARGLRSVV